MIEIQCTSCHTRYRIDERVLPDDTPTFKCSRCGHVFNADPVPAKVRKPAAPVEGDSESQPARTIRPARPRPSALKSQVESDIVKREPVPESHPTMPEPEVGVPRSNDQLRAREDRMHAAPVSRPTEEAEVPPAKDRREVDVDDPLNRTFGDREPPKADTGENLKFDFSDERNEIADAPAPEREIERAESNDGGWQVGEVPAEFEARPIRQAPSMMDDAEPEPTPRRTKLPVRRMAAPLLADAPQYAPPPAGPAAQPGFQLGHVADDGSKEAPAGTTHSSGVFLALFFFVAIAFFGLAAFICGEPAASVRVLGQAPQIGDYFARPVLPAMIVTLHDVRSKYYTLKGGHVALVISGNAQNVSERALHLVEIDANLIGDGAHPLASQSVYCGNELSATMLGEMTPREIEFSQGLSPQKAFAMEPNASAPFLMVFIDPPAGAGKIRVAVSKAIAADSNSSAPPA